MKRQLLTLIALLATGIALTAQVTHHEVKVGDFTHLTVVDDINVVYRCVPDSAGMVVVDCSQQVADGLILNLNNRGRLSVQVTTEVLQLPQLPVLTVYSSSLIEAENAGDSTLVLASAIPECEKFKVRLSDNGKIVANGLKAQEIELYILTGKGQITANGHCEKATLKVIGAGKIMADQLVATDVDCRIVGTGSINCMVNAGKLHVRGSGTGKVYYQGEPNKVTVRKLGTIKAIHMPTSGQ